MTISKDHKSLPMQRTKVACLAILVLLTACDSKGSRDRLSRTIVMECSGQSIDLASSEHEPASFLIKIDPQNRFQQSLHFFSSDDKMFVSPCESAFPECKVSVNPDLIAETGVMRGNENQVILAKMTDINRRTGSMRIIMTDSIHGERTTFEGSCKKSELPDEWSQKF